MYFSVRDQVVGYSFNILWEYIHQRQYISPNIFSSYVKYRDRDRRMTDFYYDTHEEHIWSSWFILLVSTWILLHVPAGTLVFISPIWYWLEVMVQLEYIITKCTSSFWDDMPVLCLFTVWSTWLGCLCITRLCSGLFCAIISIRLWLGRRLANQHILLLEKNFLALRENLHDCVWGIYDACFLSGSF